jgi:hypothetical protein
MYIFRIPLLILFAFFCSQAIGQIKFKTYTAATDTFYWKKYEHVLKPAKASLRKFTDKNGAPVVQAFLAHPPAAFRIVMSDSMRMHPEKPLKNYLYPVDLNNDQLPEIIYNGSGRNETEMVQVYLNLGDSFELIFEDFRYISELIRDKTGFTGITTGDPGNREDYQYTEKEYKLQSNNKSLVFIRGKQTIVYKYTQRPGKYLTSPVTFKALNDTLLVRASSRYIDAPQDPKLKTFGNIICGYTEVISGRVLAVDKDSEGRIWYFVEIFPDAKPEKSVFHDVGRYPVFITGWVDSNDISADFADGSKPH